MPTLKDWMCKTVGISLDHKTPAQVRRSMYWDIIPTAHGKQGKWPERNSLSGKTQGFGNFAKTQGIWFRETQGFGNFAKTQGIWFAEVVNSMILKVKDVSLFAAKIFNYFLSWISLPSQFCLCNSHK